MPHGGCGAMNDTHVPKRAETLQPLRSSIPCFRAAFRLSSNLRNPCVAHNVIPNVSASANGQAQIGTLKAIAAIRLAVPTMAPNACAGDTNHVNPLTPQLPSRLIHVGFAMFRILSFSTADVESVTLSFFALRRCDRRAA